MQRNLRHIGGGTWCITVPSLSDIWGDVSPCCPRDLRHWTDDSHRRYDGIQRAARLQSDAAKVKLTAYHHHTKRPWVDADCSGDGEVTAWEATSHRLTLKKEQQWLQLLAWQLFRVATEPDCLLSKMLMCCHCSALCWLQLRSVCVCVWTHYCCLLKYDLCSAY